MSDQPKTAASAPPRKPPKPPAILAPPAGDSNDPKKRGKTRSDYQKFWDMETQKKKKS
jgi:hypothetical protein